MSSRSLARSLVCAAAACLPASRQPASSPPVCPLVCLSVRPSVCHSDYLCACLACMPLRVYVCLCVCVCVCVCLCVCVFGSVRFSLSRSLVSWFGRNLAIQQNWFVVYSHDHDEEDDADEAQEDDDEEDDVYQQYHDDIQGDGCGAKMMTNQDTQQF